MIWAALCQDCPRVSLFGSREARDAAHDGRYEGVCCDACGGEQLCACRACVETMALAGVETEPA